MTVPLATRRMPSNSIALPSISNRITSCQPNVAHHGDSRKQLSIQFQPLARRLQIGCSRCCSPRNSLEVVKGKDNRSFQNGKSGMEQLLWEEYHRLKKVLSAVFFSITIAYACYRRVVKVLLVLRFRTDRKQLRILARAKSLWKCSTSDIDPIDPRIVDPNKLLS